MAKKPAAKKSVETLTHEGDKRRNIPTAEMQSVMKPPRRSTSKKRSTRRS